MRDLRDSEAPRPGTGASGHRGGAAAVAGDAAPGGARGRAAEEDPRAADPSAPTTEPAGPARSLGFFDVVALVVGIVVGAGIFRAPSAVASNVPSAGWAIAAWAAGGAVTLAGAMCYAELATAYPSAGGEYHFLRRALGRELAFLFAWARLTVIPTGSVALLAFVFGDYATEVLPLGERSSAVWALLAVAALTAVNVAGLRLGKWTQNVLTIAVVAGLGILTAAGLAVTPRPAAPPPGASGGAWGLAMVFVLLTYGGWNEAAYVSAEVRGGRRAIAAALLASVAVVTALYVGVNVAYLQALGLEGVRRSDAVAAEVLRGALGGTGATVLCLVVCAAALTSVNATLLMGSRTAYAFGRDHRLFAPLGRWSARASTPVNAVLAQGAVSLGLVVFGAATRRGFEAMVQYTAPVFWLFFLLTGASLFVLRARDRHVPRPFRVPAYPLTPLLFCSACGWLLYSSVAYSGPGALLGVAVLAAGLVPLALGAAPARRAGHALP
jgi:amino acid transporter